MNELHELEINQLAPLIQRREVSPVELTESMLRRIDSRDDQCHAFATLTPELALRQARQAEARIHKRHYLGPMHGIPIALKDLCHTQGIATAAGMPMHAGFIPSADGTVVARLAAAGAILLGKLQLTEGAFTEHHPATTVPVNPWHIDAWAGASSSGSGVAVAARLTFAAIGSDTGGSIRFPSAANGITGLKPTWGRVSRHGAFVLADSLDHLGPMCRSAADCGLMLQEIAGADPLDPTCRLAPVPDYQAGWPQDLSSLTIGIDERYNHEGTDAATILALRDAQSALQSLGARMVPIDLPDPRDQLNDWGPLCAVEAAVAHHLTFPARRDEYGPTLRGFLELASTVSAADLHRIWLRRQAFAGRVEALLNRIDLLLIPVQPDAGLTISRMASLGEDPDALHALIRYSAPFDMSGHPTITLPAGFNDQGLPIGLQLVAGAMQEQKLVLAGRGFQQVTDWHRRTPPIRSGRPVALCHRD